MNDSIKKEAEKYALENAIKFKGRAHIGAVIGKVLGAHPRLKKKSKQINKELHKIIDKVNDYSKEEQEERLEELGGASEKKKVVNNEETLFDFLEIREGQDVRTAYPPEPSKYPHIGHAKAIIMNYELAKKYSGEFTLRFEDTNPDLAEKEFYDIHLENYKWLGIKPDHVDYASDHMDEMYELAEKLIKDNHAYMCTCAGEDIKKKRFDGEECQCRYHLVNKNLVLWDEMFKSKKGKMILRLKGVMNSVNTTLRDPAIFRVIDGKHARTGDKYRVWPTYDFENSVMDGLGKITHRLRSKEFEIRLELQELIQGMLKLPRTKIEHFARFNLEGVESSGRKIRELVQKKKLMGWDDPSLTTIVALRRRGFQPKAIRDFVRSAGLTKNEATLTWDDLYVHNKRLLDKKSDRYFFIDDAKEIEIEGSESKKVELKLHPDHKEKKRKFVVDDKFYVTKEDYKSFKDGKLYRLMDCLNFKKKHGKFIVDDSGMEEFKKKGEKIIHWLPVEKGLEKVEILMPDRKIIKGFCEKGVRELEEGDVVQFVRFGFVRLDHKGRDSLEFWFTHK